MTDRDGDNKTLDAKRTIGDGTKETSVDGMEGVRSGQGGILH